MTTRVTSGETAPASFRRARAISSSAFFSVFEVERDGERGVCKRLTSRGRESLGARESLLREGAIGERLFRSAGHAVAEVLARGEDDAGPFLVTRFVEGSTLRSLDPSRVDRTFAARAFSALADLHRAGVVHGDVHLDNIILTAGGAGRFVFVDFGLAAAPPSSAFRGTALYAAPEAARGEPIDASSDRFSLAAALLHLATGVPPRTGANAAALLFEAGSTPLDAWTTRLTTAAPAALLQELTPFLRFDRAARPLDSP